MIRVDPGADIWTQITEKVLDRPGTEPGAVLAFGSRVLGFALPESDYDLYVIGENYGQSSQVQQTAVERVSHDLGVQVNLHGCSPTYAHRYRTFDPQLNAALRGGLVIRGDASPWVPCPILSATGVGDACVSARVLLEDADLPGALSHAWKQLLLATALLSDPPAWPAYYREVRADPIGVRARALEALRNLESLHQHIAHTDEDRRLLAMARR